MSRRWRIETPERITFSYGIAAPGSRLAAYLIDSIIQIAAIGIALLLLQALWANYQDVVGGFSFGFALLLKFFLDWWYYLLFEWFFDGRTPGKKTQRIRVIRDNGEPLTFPVMVLRNFLRAVDHFPVIPLVGAISVIINKENRRLGDMAASTLVVDDHRSDLVLPVSGLSVYRPTHLQGINIDPPIGLHLNENQLELIRDFLLIRRTRETERRDAAMELSRKVCEALKIDFPEKEDPIRFLEDVYVYHAVPLV